MLVVATSNRGKLIEIVNELELLQIPIVSLLDFSDVPECLETGKSFAENAREKAEFYYLHLQKPVLAEDSGLVIPVLNGFPGVHSARIAADDPARIRMVLERLQGHPDRTAYYVCNIVLKTRDSVCQVEATCLGAIAEVAEGNQGFGYDPIFRPEGSTRTFGLMSGAEKSRFSHRGKAARKMIPHLIAGFHDEKQEVQEK